MSPCPLCWSYLPPKYHVLLVASLLAATAVACSGEGEPRPPDAPTSAGNSQRPLDNVTLNAGLDPKAPSIVAFVAWLKQKGITLEHAKSPGSYGDWQVTRPKTSEEYQVIFSIRALPSWASEAQMREAIGRVNLAYMLNPAAHLAMSYGGFRGTHPLAAFPKSDDQLPHFNGLPITKAVEKLFREYRAADRDR